MPSPENTVTKSTTVPPLVVYRWSELKRRGITATSIALKIGKTPQAVSRVLNGTLRSPEIELAIATEIGEPVEQLFERRQRAARAA